MFGYIRPFVPSLRVGEYEYYRGAYCGICREMGRICGASSRLCLSYDQVFLALIRAAFFGEELRTEKLRCPALPVRRRRMLTDSDSVKYAAVTGAMLAAFKFDDDRDDERGLRRAAAKIGGWGAAPWIRRGERKYPGLATGIKEALEEYYSVEKVNLSGDVSVDAAADAFGKVSGFFTSYGLTGDNAVIAGVVGRHIGRWLFCVDAIDDMKEDEERGRGNVLLSAYGTWVLKEEEKQTLRCLLEGEASAAADALELADLPESAALNIVRNILNEGMSHVAGGVLDGTYHKPRRHNEADDRDMINADVDNGNKNKTSEGADIKMTKEETEEKLADGEQRSV